jgi:hypothetical protein
MSFRAFEVVSVFIAIPIEIGSSGQNVPGFLVAKWKVLADPVQQLWDDSST